MMSEQDIRSKLSDVGCAEADMARVMKDVAEVIWGTVLAAYLPLLSEDDRRALVALPSDGVATFIAEKGSSLPRFPQERFEAIYDDTWRAYFKAMRS